LAVNEALACGRPLLLSDKVGCAVDLIKNGLNGAVFNHMHVEECAKKLLYLASSLETLKGKDIIHSVSSWSYERKCEAIEKSFERSF
jgi:glycosyltransferase involved in cell wall biosynthesis